MPTVSCSGILEPRVSGGNHEQGWLITGASRGLGETLSGFLSGIGYDLIITAHGRNALAALSEELAELGSNVIPQAGDIADPD